jgi:hypothetical protein
MNEQERREAAITRLKARRDFWNHALVYVLVNGLLVAVWAITNSGGYFWPIWPLLGWGIGLAMHALDTFRKPISEEAIQREMYRDGT